MIFTTANVPHTQAQPHKPMKGGSQNSELSSPLAAHSTCKPLHHDIFEIATVLAHPTQAVQRFVLCCNFVSPAEMARSGFFAAGALALIVLAVSAPNAVAGPLWDYVNTPDPTFAVRGLLAG